LEWGSLLPLFSRELAGDHLGPVRRAGQQAGLQENGSELPHSMLWRRFYIAITEGGGVKPPQNWKESTNLCQRPSSSGTDRSSG
jgi:hypothetical protein